MKVFLVLLMLVCLSPAALAAENGLLRKASPHSVDVTADRFEEAINARGMKVFPRFDHAAAARDRDIDMRPTVVISFGNPAYGTPIMNKNQASGIDFPPKAIVYEDEAGRVWIAYNSSRYLYETIFARHGLEYKHSELEFYENVLEELTDYAVAPSS